jgi:hypothetical protein
VARGESSLRSFVCVATYCIEVALAVLISWRILHDCPSYDVVDGLDGRLVSRICDVRQTARRLNVHLSRSEYAQRNGRDSNYDEELSRRIKRAQYKRDDDSFKLYILWLLLNMVTSVV